MVGAVGGLGDGHGAFLQLPGLLGLRQIEQYDGEVVQAVATAGWSGP